SSSIPPPLRASLILSRHPLIRRTPSTLELTYHAHSSALRRAISNPVPENVYFSKGSLAHRRFQKAEYEREKEAFGAAIAGTPPAVGDIPPERPLEILERDHWAKLDAERGERSLERHPDQEIFCLIKEKESKKWEFPTRTLKENDSLHTAAEQITGVGGILDGQTMDTWLVTKKPVGLTQKDGQRTFYLRSHILGGEPKLSSSGPWSDLAWLNLSELEERLKAQGDEPLWDGVKAIFGVPKIPTSELGFDEASLEV
ncbi:hypothetical protein BD324DRAFT_583915, partial [Kockovaella imperatae]